MRENAHLATFEEIELFGKRVLFIDARIDTSTSPSNVHLYEVRGDGYGNISSIEPLVRVNFEGTIISSEIINLNLNDRVGTPWCEITPDSVNYLGTESTLEKYMISQGLPYQLENNAGYAIIKNKYNTYVIGYRKSTPDCSPFVVWRKNQNGYNHGYYCDSYQEAYENMDERYQELIHPISPNI